ncbi:hypothetical protein J7I98_28460 [Streptomyces sp. ISL-98]|uniref:hypothetical protein n=1 Tax=Streptomyces sp. ISL-98 TaxID=2819192 RepID=UPI001BE74004|nr:hypothetical protein [Streptomyces sp. ISL-98]MBT2509734.1 hypothetical protein [Streptomyces sp. ISL-98]
MATDEEALLAVLGEEILAYQIAELLPEQRAAADLELARCSAALVAHALLRHDSAVAAVRIEEDSDPDERYASAAISAEGAERDLTDAESDDLGGLDSNLMDSNAAAWHPLCRDVDDRHGVYVLDVAGALESGREVLARRASSSR